MHPKMVLLVILCFYYHLQNVLQTELFQIFPCYYANGQLWKMRACICSFLSCLNVHGDVFPQDISWIHPCKDASLLLKKSRMFNCWLKCPGARHRYVWGTNGWCVPLLVFVMIAGLISIVRQLLFSGWKDWEGWMAAMTMPSESLSFIPYTMTGCFLWLLPSSSCWNKEATTKVWCSLLSHEMTWSHRVTDSLASKVSALHLINHMTLGRSLHHSFLNGPIPPVWESDPDSFSWL